MGIPTETIRAIKELGKTNHERAARLMVTTRTISKYRAGKIPIDWRRLMLNIPVLEALLEDARAGRVNGNHE